MIQKCIPHRNVSTTMFSKICSIPVSTFICFKISSTTANEKKCSLCKCVLMWYNFIFKNVRDTVYRKLFYTSVFSAKVFRIIIHVIDSVCSIHFSVLHCNITMWEHKYRGLDLITEVPVYGILWKFFVSTWRIFKSRGKICKMYELLEFIEARCKGHISYSQTSSHLH